MHPGIDSPSCNPARDAVGGTVARSKSVARGGRRGLLFIAIAASALPLLAAQSASAGGHYAAAWPRL